LREEGDESALIVFDGEKTCGKREGSSRSCLRLRLEGSKEKEDRAVPRTKEKSNSREKRNQNPCAHDAKRRSSRATRPGKERRHRVILARGRGKIGETCGRACPFTKKKADASHLFGVQIYFNFFGTKGVGKGLLRAKRGKGASLPRRLERLGKKKGVLRAPESRHRLSFGNGGAAIRSLSRGEALFSSRGGKKKRPPGGEKKEGKNRLASANVNLYRLANFV